MRTSFLPPSRTDTSNCAARAVENAAPVEIRTERGFPQGAWKASRSTFPTSASSSSFPFLKPKLKQTEQL
jgi:hypothetical protein